MENILEVNQIKKNTTKLKLDYYKKLRITF